MNDTITKEQVLAAYNSAPDFVRAAFNDEKTTRVVIELRARFQLHVDSAGLLGKGVGHMLLGLVSPEEFLKELIAAKISEKDAREILAEINQKIFVPLRDEMRKEPVPAPKSPVTQAIPAPTASKPIVAPASSAATPRVLIPAPPVRKPALRDVLASVMKAPPAPVAPIVPAPAPTPAAPSAPPQRVAPPENLPGVPRPLQAAPAAPTPESRTEPPKQSALAVPAKSYSIDPYREPVDEK